MGFGPIMRLTVGELEIKLAPLSKDVMGDFIAPGMQQHSIVKYVHTPVQVLENEEEWYDAVRKDEKKLVWGIWVEVGEEWILIGTTSYFNINRDVTYQATTGSMIFRKEYWGKGIAKHIHMARTWYGFKHMGLHRIMSAVVQDNEASLRALKHSGYDLVYVERNTHFADGRLLHQDNLECLNPVDPFWSTWWNGDRPVKRMVQARKRTLAAMEWAEQNVELP